MYDKKNSVTKVQVYSKICGGNELYHYGVLFIAL